MEFLIKLSSIAQAIKSVYWISTINGRIYHRNCILFSSRNGIVQIGMQWRFLFEQQQNKIENDSEEGWKKVARLVLPLIWLAKRINDAIALDDYENENDDVGDMDDNFVVSAWNWDYKTMHSTRATQSWSEYRKLTQAQLYFCSTNFGKRVHSAHFVACHQCHLLLGWLIIWIKSCICFLLLSAFNKSIPRILNVNNNCYYQVYL